MIGLHHPDFWIAKQHESPSRNTKPKRQYAMSSNLKATKIYCVIEIVWF
jgi:hypothetical protein